MCTIKQGIKLQFEKAPIESKSSTSMDGALLVHHEVKFTDEKRQNFQRHKIFDAR